MDVKLRHLAATPVGRSVRAITRVIAIDARSVVFGVEAWNGDRRIGDGTHRRGIVDVTEFEKRFGVRECVRSLIQFAPGIGFTHSTLSPSSS